MSLFDRLFKIQESSFYGDEDLAGMTQRHIGNYKKEKSLKVVPKEEKKSNEDKKQKPMKFKGFYPRFYSK
jgi:hypothetical protein